MVALFSTRPASASELLTQANTRDRRIVKRWHLPGRPSGIAVSADGTVYVGLAAKQSVAAIDPKKGAIIMEVILDSEEIAATKELVTLRINPRGDRLIVANGSDESVTILSLPDLAVVREIGLEGESIRDALPDPAGRYLYVMGRTIHVFDAEGNRELRSLDGLQPMAIATDSAGTVLAVVGGENFSNGRATSVALYETTGFKSGEPEPLQTDRMIEAAVFGANDRALLVFARDWLAEKQLTSRAMKAVTPGADGQMRMRFDFGDLVSSELICLPEGSGPQIIAAGGSTDTVYLAEKRCGSAGSFTASPRKVGTGSLYAIDAYALAYHKATNTIYATDPAGYLTIYKAPKPDIAGRHH